MSANLAVAAAPTPATLRAELAAAVAKLLSAETAATKLTRAASDAQEATVSALGDIDRAKDAMAKAGAVDADALAASVLVGKPAARLASRREARAAVTDADDRLAETRSIRDALASKAEEAKTSLGFAASSARAAALAVVQATSASGIAAFIAETERLQRDLQDRLAAIAWLRREHLVPFLDPTISRIVSFNMVNDPGVPQPLKPGGTAAKWEGVIATLTRDAKAPASIP
jgi:hypothetical protein